MSFILRHSEPSKFDEAAHGSVCKVPLKHDDYEIYVQMSHDDDHVRWESIGIFNERTHDDFVQEEINRTLLRK